MKIILSSKKHHYVARVSVFLVMIALIAGMVGCGQPAPSYNLTTNSTAGGLVTTPREGTSNYDEGMVVDLTAEADAILAGEVSDISCYQEGVGNIYTLVTLSVEQTIKGPTQEEVVIKLPGGEVEGLGLWVSGIPSFQLGERVVVFLQKAENSTFQLYDWYHSKFTVTDSWVLGKDQSLTGFIADICQAVEAQGITPKISIEPAGEVLENPVESRARPLNTEEFQTSWQTIKSEDFEGAFPNDWNIWVSSGYTDAYWDDDSYNPHWGSWSGFCADEGTAGVDPPSDYPNNMRTWMVYGPFSLADATDAELNFYDWLKTEPGYDYFKYLASIDGTYWYGWQVSGDSSGWEYRSFDLTDVPTLGNICGQPEVWIAFVFTSDGSVTNKGAFIDDIELRKYVSGIDYPDALWVPADLSNYTPSDRPTSYPIQYVIIHVAQGYYAGTIAWFQNPDSDVSAHYVIRSSDGEITQMVRHKDIAWHAGNWEYNTWSIGIEHEGWVDQPSYFTDQMYQSSADLTRYICDLYGIPKDRNHIIGHSEVPGSTHTDPGPYWDWDYYMQLVTGTTPPHIDSISETSGSAGTGFQVTIYGTNFGSTQDSSTVSFWRRGSEYVEAPIVSWSNTQIVCEVPAGASSGDTSHGVRVTTSGGTSNDYPFSVIFSYGEKKWFGANPMGEKIWINPNTADCTGEWRAVINAMQTWNDVDNANFYFEYGGLTSASDKSQNGYNEVMWVNYDTGSIATCWTWYYPSTGEIVENDIVLNDLNYTWDTSGMPSGTEMDVQNIVTHELGHCLNLMDLYGTADQNKTMYGYGASGETKKRSLETADIAGIRWIYPGMGTRGQYHIRVTNNDDDDLTVYFKSDIDAEYYRNFDVPSGQILTSWWEVVPSGSHQVTIKWTDPDKGTEDTLTSAWLDVPIEGDTEFAFTIPRYPQPHLTFSSDTYTIGEGAGTATIMVNLSTASAQTVTVDYATSGGTAIAGSDYTVASGTLTFSPGETSKTFSVTILEDALVEGDEMVNLSLSNPTNATLGTPSTAVLNIVDNDPIVFPDPNLEAAIREAIGKPSGDIYQFDLDGLTTLNADQRGIVDLTGLEYCTSLTSLSLYDNEISNIAPLSSLTSLTWLGLGSNEISDIASLSSLTSLTNLYLNDNEISDIAPLSSLTSLTSLFLQRNQISDIEPLVNNLGLSTGDYISLGGNPLNTTSVNVYIPQLEGRGVTVYWDTANQLPNQPSNVSPADTATGISLTPTLTSSAFSDPDVGDTHAASQWQITTTPSNYSSTVFDSGTDAANLESIAIPSGTLSESTTYYWHVRHQDNRGDWSSWSQETSFNTIAPPPTITTVSPDSGIQGQTLSSVTITGTYFTGATSVSFGSGITVNSFTVDSSTQITTDISISSGATPGARAVSVTTPGGTATKTGGFTVNQAPPTITSVSPNSDVQGETLSSVIITGTYFTGATSVSFGSGITVNSFTVDSSTQITASITISGSATTGARDVSVTTPGGTATKTGGFTVNQAPPTITSVSPNSGVQGETLSSVIITGTYFTGATSVSFGSGITVNSFTVDSSTQITASITISGSATTGARDVSVTTPGGTATKASGFTVTQPTPQLMEGDVTLDKCVKASDAMFILQYLVGIRALDEDQLKCADTTDDGEVSAVDAMHILQWLVDSDGSLGVLYKPLWESPKDGDLLEPDCC